jgi:hypothetical protein
MEWHNAHLWFDPGHFKNRVDPVDPVEKVPPQAAKSFCSKKGVVEKCPTQ